MTKIHGLPHVSLIYKPESDNIYQRGSVIPSNYVSRRLNVYTGGAFKSILIRPKMAFMKFGSFVFTKLTGLAIHKRKRKKKQKPKRGRK